MKFTRDSTVWYVGMATGGAGFAFTHFDHLSKLLSQMLPFLSPETFGLLKAWAEFISFTGTSLCAYMRMSPRPLSVGHQMAILPEQTLKGMTSQATIKVDSERIKQAIPIDTAMLKRPEKKETE